MSPCPGQRLPAFTVQTRLECMGCNESIRAMHSAHSPAPVTHANKTLKQGLTYDRIRLRSSLEEDTCVSGLLSDCAITNAF